MHYTDVTHVMDDMQRPFPKGVTAVPKGSSGFSTAVTPLYAALLPKVIFCDVFTGTILSSPAARFSSTEHSAT